MLHSIVLKERYLDKVFNYTKYKLSNMDILPKVLKYIQRSLFLRADLECCFCLRFIGEVGCEYEDITKRFKIQK